MPSRTVQRLLAKLRRLRTDKGWTQEEFSERSGISYKYYQAVEAGRKKDLRLSTLDRLAKAHQLEPWELLFPDAGEPQASTPRKRARRPAGG